MRILILHIGEILSLMQLQEASSPWVLLMQDCPSKISRQRWEFLWTPCTWVDSSWLLQSVKTRFICQYLSERTKSVVESGFFQDAGQYKCRVDYHLQQTSFQLLDVSVIVPPELPIIFYSGQPGMIKIFLPFSIYCSNSCPRINWAKARIIYIGW